MAVTVKEIIHWLDSQYPPHWAEDWDRVGLQLGDPGQKVRRLGIALEASPRTVQWATSESIQLLLCHHPLLFQPISRLRYDREPGRTVRELFRGEISLWVAHTNLDAAPEGVSTALARRLGLTVLKPLEEKVRDLCKLVVFVPAGYEEPLQQALKFSNIGQIGDYRFCTFSSRGEGRFTPEPGSHPFQGIAGLETRAPETRLEVQVPLAQVDELLKRLRASHPYEEMAYDLYPLQNSTVGVGIGRQGIYEPPLSWDQFIPLLREGAEAPLIQVAGKIPEKVERVAVCGGAGRSLIPAALAARVQVFVTGEIGHHPSVEFSGEDLALVSIGHYVSEKWILPVLGQQLTEAAEAQGWELEVRIHLEPGDPTCRYF
jgi:dinuclear metal center YbgI/SA1388 family protein